MDKEDEGWIPLQDGWIVMRDEQSEGLPIAITLESGDRIQFRQHPDGTTSVRRVPAERVGDSFYEINPHRAWLGRGIDRMGIPRWLRKGKR